MLTINFKEIRRRGLTIPILWDFFMIWVAIINVSMIIFDLSYLILRPYYHHYLPLIQEKYDPIKGIEKHRSTDRYLYLVDEIKQSYQRNGRVTFDIDKKSQQLISLSAAIIRENPFELSGQTASLEKAKYKIKRYINRQQNIKDSQSATRAFAVFWRLNDQNIESRLAFFDKEIRTLFKVNFFRHRDISGGYVDEFWKYDLPFWLLFFVEFIVRWILAIKRKTYIRWFVFPIYNWYDLLGLIPAKGMRIFRLFRIVSIYVRLSRSSLTTIGDDIISSTVKKYSNIIVEEISDIVAIRILSEIQDEVKQGTSANMIAKALEPKRMEIKQLVLRKADTFTQEKMVDLKPRVKALSRVSVRNAIIANVADIPMPKVMIRPMTDWLSDLVVEIVFNTITATVADEEGRRAIDDIVDEILTISVAELQSETIDIMVKDILHESIENIKERVAIKKWAQLP